MTQVEFQKAISKNIVELAVYKTGNKLLQTGLDQIDEFQIREVVSNPQKSNTSFCYSGRVINVLIKAVTEEEINLSNDILNHSCDQKTYNALISNRKNINPLVLILVVFPKDISEWMTFGKEFLMVKNKLFWYLPSLEKTIQKEKSTMIEIQKENLINENTFSQIFDFLYNF